jgi:hypothetical protein
MFTFSDSNKAKLLAVKSSLGYVVTESRRVNTNLRQSVCEYFPSHMQEYFFLSNWNAKNNIYQGNKHFKNT